MSDLFTKLMVEGQQQKQQVETTRRTPGSEHAGTGESTPEPTSVHDRSRDIARDNPRDSSREIPRGLPTRDEIQGFSFQLRDELKVKVQAEVPHGWQEELEAIALRLKVKKLELYRFIIGEFLGKVQRRTPGT